MKKFLVFVLSVLLTFCCAIGFAACAEEPHEHSFGEWTVTAAATCIEPGEEQRTCSCGETETREIAPLGHAFDGGKVTTPATCTQAGVMTYTCERCGEIKTEATVMADHTEVIDAAVAPTCTEPGQTEGKYCSVCHTVLVSSANSS